MFGQINLIDVQRIIEMGVERLCQLQTPQGLFKTFRMDYSEAECPNGYINEIKALPIETTYDHSFILEILLRLGKHSSDRNNFLKIILKGLKCVMDDVDIKTQYFGNNNFKIFQWRYYKIYHHSHGKILPDIDNTGRNLIFTERLREIFCDEHVKALSGKFAIINNPYNYRQFWKLLSPLNNAFKPDYNFKDPKFFGLLTYVGNKEDNDVDPVCNITALYSALLFFNKNFLYINEDDIVCIKRILDYLFGFLNSDIIHEIHEYYEPIAVFYNYSKLIELCENLQPPLRNLVQIEKINKSRLFDLLLRELKQNKWKNPLEKAFGITSLIILGYRGNKLEDKIMNIINDQKNGCWEAFRFYRQRHPYRISALRLLQPLPVWKL